jgi:hypothetical protein
MKLKEIEKLCEEATSGPWFSSETTSLNDNIKLQTPVIRAASHLTAHGTLKICSVGNGNKEERDKLNAKFIAASRTFMPKLLAIAKEMKNFDQMYWFQPSEESGVCCFCDGGQDPAFIDNHEPTCLIQKIHDALEDLEEEE